MVSFRINDHKIRGAFREKVAILRQNSFLIPMKILADYLIHLIEYAHCKGLPNSGITRPAPQTLIPLNTYVEAYEHYFRAANDPYFGLRFGYFLNLKALGSVYEISLTTTCLEQTLEIWQSYVNRVFPILQIHLRKDADSLTMHLTTKLQNPAIQYHILDTVFTFMYRELRLMLGQEKVIVRVPYEDLGEYASWYQTEILPGSDHQFQFELALLNHSINEKRRQSFALLLPSFLSLLHQSNHTYHPFTLAVRTMILNMSDPVLPTLDQVASQFILTPRTLQRRLKDEGISFRDLCNNIKQELYNYLKKGNHLKTGELALLLGYSRTSSLIHAIQHWEAAH